MILQSFPLNKEEYIGAEVVQLWHYGRTTGVFSADENLRVKVKTGMTISVESGVGWLNYSKFGGVVFCNQNATDFQLDIADGLLKRIDRVVVSYDLLNEKIELKVKKGSFASTPVAPAIIRNESFYEIALADILVDKGTLAITQGNITDQRLNESLCGLVKNSVDSIPSQSLQDKYVVEFQKWFDGIKTNLDENTAGNLLNMIQGQETEVKQIDSAVKTGYFQITAKFLNGTYNATTRIATWSINEDLTNLIKVGAKLKFQSNLGITYAIVHNITNTQITLFHQAGTTALPTPSTGMINVGISRPVDFPVDDGVNWTVVYDLVDIYTVNNPVAGTFYTTPIAVTLGIGTYKVATSAIGSVAGSFASNNNQCYFGTGASTTPSLRSKKVIGTALATTTFTSINYMPYWYEETVQVISGTTTHRCLVMSGVVGATSIRLMGSTGGCYMLATSIYA